MPHSKPSLFGLHPRLLAKGLVMIATLAACGYLLKVTGLSNMLDTGWIDHEIKGKGLSGEAVYIGIGALAVAIGVPRQVICFLGGYAFGFTIGTALASVASLLGCIAAFFYARLIARELVESKFSARIKRVDDFLRDNPLTMALLIRLLPVGSNLLTNLVAGVSSVKPVPFFIGSALGYLPQTAIFVLLGSGINLDPEIRISASVALFVASGVLGAWIYKRYKHEKTLDESLDRELEEEQA